MDSEDFRRAWVYAAWILLLAAAVEVALGAWALSGLPGGPMVQYHTGSLFAPATAAPLWFRATQAMPNLVDFPVTALPVAAVLLVALAGCPAGTTRRVSVTAVTIQAFALALSLIAWVAVLGNTSGWTPFSWAVEIAVAVAGLIGTSAVLRSRGAVAMTRPRAGAGKR